MSRMQEAQEQFNSIKADMKRTQRECYDKSSRELHIPEGKQVYVRRLPPSSQPKGPATRFIRQFDGPYIVTGHVHGRQDLLRLRHKFTQAELKTVNIEKVIVVPDELSDDLTTYEDQLPNTETVKRSELPTQQSSLIDPELAKLAFAFGQYLNDLPSAQAYASEACKVVYQQIPDAQDLLKRYGKLKGLLTKCFIDASLTPLKYNVCLMAWHSFIGFCGHKDFLLIGKLESARRVDTVLVGDDTDLLIYCAITQK